MGCGACPLIWSCQSGQVVFGYINHTHTSARARARLQGAPCSSPCVISRCYTRTCKTNLFGCARPVTRARRAPDLPHSGPTIVTWTLLSENRACPTIVTWTLLSENRTCPTIVTWTLLSENRTCQRGPVATSGRSIVS